MFTLGTNGVKTPFTSTRKLEAFIRELPPTQAITVSTDTKVFHGTAATALRANRKLAKQGQRGVPNLWAVLSNTKDRTPEEPTNAPNV